MGLKAIAKTFPKHSAEHVLLMGLHVKKRGLRLKLQFNGIRDPADAFVEAARMLYYNVGVIMPGVYSPNRVVKEFSDCPWLTEVKRQYFEKTTRKKSRRSRVKSAERPGVKRR